MGSLGVGGSLSAASDVSLSSPANGQSLKRSGSYWVNAAISKSDINLSNVDNTSDANKPISTAQASENSRLQGEINAKTTVVIDPASTSGLADGTLIAYTS